jgi:hypothetical protein
VCLLLKACRRVEPSPTFASWAWFGGDAEAEYGVDIEFRLIL